MENEININFTSTSYVDKQQPNNNFYKSEKLFCGSFYNNISLNSVYKSLFKFNTINIGKKNNYQYASIFLYIENFKSISNTPITLTISKCLSNYNEYTVNWYSIPKSNMRNSLSFEVSKEDIGTYIEINITPLLSPLNNPIENTSFILEPANTRTTSIIQIGGNYSNNPPYITLFPSFNEINTLSYGNTAPVDEYIPDYIPNSKLKDIYSIFSQYSKKINSLEKCQLDQQDEIKNLNKKLTKLEELTLDFGKDFESLNTSINNLNDKITTISENNTTLNKLFNDNVTLTSEKILASENTFNSKFATKTEVNLLNSSVATAIENFNSITDSINTINSLITENSINTSKKITDLESFLSSVHNELAPSEEINNLKTSISSITDKYNSLSSTIKKNTITSSEKFITLENSFLNILKKYSLASDLLEVKEGLNDISNTLSTLSITMEQTNSATANKISSIETSLTNFSNNYTTKKQISTLKTSLSSTLDKINFLENSLKPVIKIDSLFEKIEILQNDFSSLNEDFNTISAKFNEVNTTIAAVNDKASSHDKVFQEIGRLKSSFITLLNSMNDLKASFSIIDEKLKYISIEPIEQKNKQ